MAQVSATEVATVTLDELYNGLAAVQPNASIQFPLGGSPELTASFNLYEGCDLASLDAAPDALSNATVRIRGDEYGITNGALRQAFKVAQIQAPLVKKLSVRLTTEILNFVYANGSSDSEYQAHIVGDGNVAALSKGTIVPFNNVQLLDQVVAAMRVKYGHEDLIVDKHVHNTLERTAYRLVVPDTIKEIRSARRSAHDPDNWSIGVQVINSLIGQESLKLSGFVYAYFCTNGATTELTNSGTYDRRHSQDPTEAYEWARTVVEEVLGGLESELDRIDHLTQIPLEGDVSTVINDVFQTHRVPSSLRRQIVDNLVESDDLTAYGLMNAITAVANHSDLSDREATDLFRIGGEMPHTLAHLCQSCRRPVN